MGKKCNPSKKVSKAGKVLSSSTATNKQKSNAGSILSKHKNEKHK